MTWPLSIVKNLSLERIPVRLDYFSKTPTLPLYEPGPGILSFVSSLCSFRLVDALNGAAFLGRSTAISYLCSVESISYYPGPRLSLEVWFSKLYLAGLEFTNAIFFSKREIFITANNSS